MELKEPSSEILNIHHTECKKKKNTHTKLVYDRAKIRFSDSDFKSKCQMKNKCQGLRNNKCAPMINGQ